MEWLLVERPALNAGIRQACAEGLAPTCWELAAASSLLFAVNNHVEDWSEAAAWSLRAARAAGSRFGEAVALVEEGLALEEMIRLDESYASAARAADLFEALGEPHGHATAA